MNVHGHCGTRLKDRDIPDGGGLPDGGGVATGVADEHASVSPGRGVTVAVLLLASLTVMANATISPSLPGLRDHYAELPNIDVLAGLLVTLPSLAVALTAGLMGWLVDKTNRQRLMVVSALLYALGGTSGLWAVGLTAMLVGRLVLGVGVAGTMVLGTAWASDLWQGEARATLLGRQGAATSIGGIAVILTGGALASLHWRGAFATYLLVLPAAWFAFRALAPYENRRGEKPAASAELCEPADVFPWQTFAFVGPLAFMFMVTFYVLPTQLPFRLGELGVTNPLVLAGVTAIVTLTALPGALAYGRLSRHFSAMTIFAFSWALMGAGLLIIAVAPSVAITAAGVAVVGLGGGPGLPNYTRSLLAVVPPALVGRASGLLTTAFFAGQFASPLLSAPLISAVGLSEAFRVLGLTQLVLAGMLTTAALGNRRGIRS